MNIVVLAGGLSPERNVSLSSGSLIASALRRKGHKVLLLDVYFGIDMPKGADPLSLFTSEQSTEFSVDTNVPDLKALKEQGHFLAVASNKYQAATEKIVAQLFPGIFDVVLGERVGVERKPHPQIVYDVLHRLSPLTSNLSPILYIGDSLVDAETARTAGATLVLCTWGFGTKEQMEGAQPDYLVNHPLEVLEVLEVKG